MFFPEELLDKSKKIILQNGTKQQTIKCLEELAELQLNILHNMNFKASDADVLEEIADVYIVISQLFLMFDYNKEFEIIFKKKFEKFCSNIYPLSEV